MSAEYRPVHEIPFRNIDERLEKYGIQVCEGELVEGPSIGDANFTIAWLMATVEVDEALEAYFQKSPLS
jgi:hypothetical protein